MAKVLIVAKTRMTPTMVCVGGLNLENNQNIRLLRPGSTNQTPDTPFEVGQFWELDFYPPNKITPPHVEDVIVSCMAYIDTLPELRDFLMERVHPWQDGLNQLFNGMLTLDYNNCYISQARISPCSTGYWLPDKPLTLVLKEGKPYYTIEQTIKIGTYSYNRGFSIKYVGFAEPVERLPAGSLLRVSLARWWAPKEREYEEKKCFLQLSGWYS